jgi:hypothetical protein
MDTLSFFYLSLKFLPFSSPEDQEKKEKKSKVTEHILYIK